jgi:hypothetical protein
MTPDLSSAQWRKSSRSDSNGGACVEIARLAVGYAVRDSKNPAGPALLFTPMAWGSFVNGVKDDAFGEG